jgi:hypothetical protein
MPISFGEQCRKAKLNELAANSNTKNITDLYWGISGFKEGLHPRKSIVKDEKE